MITQEQQIIKNKMIKEVRRILESRLIHQDPKFIEWYVDITTNNVGIFLYSYGIKDMEVCLGLLKKVPSCSYSNEIFEHLVYLK